MNCVGLLSRIITLKYFLIYSTPPTPISLSIPLAAPNGLQEARERRFKFMSEAPRERVIQKLVSHDVGHTYTNKETIILPHIPRAFSKS